MFKTKKSKEKVLKTRELKFTLDKGKVTPEITKMGKHFYYKVLRGISASLTYNEFVDYILINYCDFLNKDIIKKYRNREEFSINEEYDFKELYSMYKLEPTKFRIPVYVVYCLIEVSEKNLEKTKLEFYEGPSETELCIKSNYHVYDLEGNEVSMDIITKSYTSMFLERYGESYNLLLSEYPIDNRYEYLCLCFVMDRDKSSLMANDSLKPKEIITDVYNKSIEKYLSYKFDGSQLYGWACCYKIIEGGEDFRPYLQVDNLSSYVLSRMVSLHNLLGLQSYEFFKYRYNSCQSILEELLSNGYDTRVLNPSVVRPEHLYMVPIAIEMNMPFLEVYKHVGEFSLYALCCLRVGIDKELIFKNKLDKETWDNLIVKLSLKLYKEELDLTGVLTRMRKDNPTNYKHNGFSQTNDFFLENLRDIR